jgi:acetyl esterase/lipase
MTGANLTLRFGAARLRAGVSWPPGDADAQGLALALGDELAWADTLLAGCVVVSLLTAHPRAEELDALEWLAEHAAELGAGSDRLVVAGGARAARLAIAARDTGWPRLHRQVLVHPRFSPENPIPSSVAGVAPATIVHSDDPRDDGPRYAALLRDAGVGVEEVRW